MATNASLSTGASFVVKGGMELPTVGQSRKVYLIIIMNNVL